MSTTRSEASEPSPPPAEGVRLAWEAVPIHVRAAIEEHLGSAVVAADSQRGGFSPGVAARLRLADGRRVFVKLISSVPNPESPKLHRREARVAAVMPPSAPVPRLLWSYDEGEDGWVALVFEDVEGKQPAQPWRLDELERVLKSLATLHADLTPSPLSASVVGTASELISTYIYGWQKLQAQHPSRLTNLDAWSTRHLDALAELEKRAAAAVSGETLLHFDIRADNILLTSEKVWFVDWPHACVGAAWVDVVGFAPSVTMQGGPPPEEILARHPSHQHADPADITAAIVAIAGFFTYGAIQPPPPGLPTLRAFQAAQGAVAREWVAQRTGWV